jgi:hypothetical protein
MPDKSISAPGFVIGGLEHSPRIASRLGLYLAQITGLEITITSIFANLTGIRDRDVAEAIFGRIINISTRLQILSDIVSLRPDESWPAKDDLMSLIKDAEGINSKRNEYVHGTFQVEAATGRVWLNTWYTSTGRKRKRFEITAESVDEDIQAVRIFLGRYIHVFRLDHKLEAPIEPTTLP